LQPLAIILVNSGYFSVVKQRPVADILRLVAHIPFVEGWRTRRLGTGEEICMARGCCQRLMERIRRKIDKEGVLCLRHALDKVYGLAPVPIRSVIFWGVAVGDQGAVLVECIVELPRRVPVPLHEAVPFAPAWRDVRESCATGIAAQVLPRQQGLVAGRL